MLAFLTPSCLPGATRCRVIKIPDCDAMEALVVGALLPLTYAENWEQLGTSTPEQTAFLMLQMLQEFNDGEVCMPIGTVLTFAGAVLPDGFLLCDGGEYDSVVYGQLFNAIGSVYGSTAPGKFKVPDFRGRVAMGQGSGTGLTPRVLGDMNGKETVVLSESELAPHKHTNNAHSHASPPHSHSATTAAPNATVIGAGVPQATAVPNPLGFTGATAVAIDSVIVSANNAGGGEAHENMQPALVLNQIIKYK